MPLSSDALSGFRLDTIRGAPGYFRVGQLEQNQSWWLFGPDNRVFFGRAVNGVTQADVGEADPLARLRSWGFNALGADSAVELRDESLPSIGTVDFLGTGPIVRASGICLPDVFDLSWADAARSRAKQVCGPALERRDLLGWLADDGLGWGASDNVGGPTLLQVCLSLEPRFAAYHSAWEFALAPHAGDLRRLARAWGCALANKEVVRERTRAESGINTAGHLRDNETWTGEFARRYFAGTSAAIRAADPRHLIFGARDTVGGARGSGRAWLRSCAYPASDVAWIHAVDIAAAPPGPVWVGNFNWAAEQFWKRSPRSKARGVTTVERMLRQGRRELRSLLGQPSVVGYSWAAWLDEPGEQPPFARGLVHRNGAEAREHTELLTDIHHRLPTLRPFVP